MRNVHAGYKLSAEAALLASTSVATPSACPNITYKSTAVKEQIKRGKGSVAASKNYSLSDDAEKSYPSDVKMILKNVTLDIEQNSKIAILGKNGMQIVPIC